MEKRPPSKGWNECGFYIERTPDFGSNWGVGGNSVRYRLQVGVAASVKQKVEACVDDGAHDAMSLSACQCCSIATMTAEC